MRPPTHLLPVPHPTAARATALLAAGALGLGLALVPFTPARAVPDTDITELSLDAASSTSTTRQERSRSSAPRDQQGGGEQQDPDGATVLAELPEQETEEFSTLGVTWDEDSDGPAPQVEFRTRGDDGWSGWTAIEDDSLSGSNGRVGTDPIYVGESDGVQIRLSGSAETEVREPKVALVAAAATADDSRLQTTAAAAAVPGMAPRPAYVSRSGWGANESWRCEQNDVDDTIQAAIVHHTAGSNSYSKAESASVVRGIYAYHTRTLGWCDIGYNFLVDKYGQVFEGRAGGVDLPVHGAHATSWNTDTVGVSFMGNYETATPSSAMLEAGAKVIAWKFDANYRDPLGKVTLAGKNINRISGHGDVMSTACPGKNVRSKMGSLRERVRTLAGNRNTPIYQRWQALGADGGDAGSPHRGERVVAGGRDTQFTRYDIFSSADTRTSWTAGDIRARYRQLKGPFGALGFPVTDEQTWPASGIRSNRFESGAILWTSAAKAHVIRGGFWPYYNGSSTRRGWLGAPTTDEYAHPGLKMPVQEYQGGMTFWVSGKGQLLRGRIASYYKGLSDDQQRQRGVPVVLENVSESYDVPVQRLSAATMFWHGGKVKETYGKINDKYRSLGAEESRLGLPLSTEKAGSNGSRYSDFEGGRITWANGKATVSYS